MYASSVSDFFFTPIMSLKWFLNDIFSSLDRGFLLESKSRQQMVQYFNAIIEQFRNKRTDSNGKEECKLVVQAAIEFHEKAKAGNENICLCGKYHNILYVAARLCHQWDLQDTDIVCSLLACIYACEKSFEKFFECSIFGTKVTQLISGWRSDYSTHDENMSASVYFLEHAIRGCLEFIYGDRECNFIDVPMQSYEESSPLKMAVKAEKWDVVILMIKYGAITHLPEPTGYQEAYRYSLFQLFVQKLEKYHNASYYQSALILAFKLFTRTISSLPATWTTESEGDEDARTWPEVVALFHELGIESKSEPRSLKHLAKCAARQYLAKHHRLPAHCDQLGIPKTIESYLNLNADL